MANRFKIFTVFQGVDRITKPVSRMQQSVLKFTRSTKKGLESVNSVVNSVGSSIKSVGKQAGLLSASAGGLLAVTAGLTAADTEAQMLAKSVNMNVGEIDALTKAVSGAGFQFDNVIDLVEEMNNKLGESAGLEEITPVSESLEILGLSFEKIKKLSPENQFKAITNAALAMEDAQKAAAAADILLGGEANKIIGVLRQQGSSVDEITKKYKELSLRSDESRKGALAFNRQMKDITGVISSASSEIAGLVGKALAPLLEKLTNWVRANRELLKTRISEFVDNLNKGLTWLIANFSEIVAWTKKIGIALGVFIAFSAILKSLIAVLTLVNLVMAANPVTLIVLGIVALIAAVAALIIWWDKIVEKFPALGTAADLVAGVFKGFVNVMTAVPKLIISAWEPVRSFFSNLWGSITDTFKSGMDRVFSIVNKVKNVVGKAKSFVGGIKSKFGFGSSNDEQQQEGVQLGSTVTSPQERISRRIEESRTTSQSEVTIRDETGRAEMTRNNNRNIVLESSAVFP